MTARKRHHRLAIVLLLATVLVAPLGLTSCGDDSGEDRVTGMPESGSAAPRPTPAPQPPAQQAGPQQATSGTAEGQLAGVVPFLYSDAARDPFMRQYPDLPSDTAEATMAVLPPEDTEEREPGVLAGFPVESLRLVAIVTRSAGPRAMFIVPDGSGRAVMAQQWDRVGPDGRGHISRIEPNRVVIEFEEYSFGPEGESLEHAIYLRDPATSIQVCEGNARFGVDCEAEIDRVD